VTPTSIFGIANNMSVHEYSLYATKGAGSDYSLGALYTAYDTIDDGYELVRTALEAACHFSLYCREPLDIIEVKAEDFGKPVKGYKEHSNALRTMQKRKTPGNLLEVVNGTNKTSTVNGRSKAGVKAAAQAATQAGKSKSNYSSTREEPVSRFTSGKPKSAPKVVTAKAKSKAESRTAPVGRKPKVRPQPAGRKPSGKKKSGR
jgi:hypothetical protein